MPAHSPCGRLQVTYKSAQEDMHEGCLRKVLSPSAPAQTGMLSTTSDCILVLFSVFLTAVSNLGKTHYIFYVEINWG